MVANILPANRPTLTIGAKGQNSTFSEQCHVAYQIKSNQIKSNQINFIGIKSSHRTVTSHMYTVTQEQSQT